MHAKFAEISEITRISAIKMRTFVSERRIFCASIVIMSAKFRKVMNRNFETSRHEAPSTRIRDFCIRKFFYADTKISASTRSVYESYTTVHTYPIRIRTSQRISQQSMENLARKKTGSDTVTSVYTKISGYVWTGPYYLA